MSLEEFLGDDSLGDSVWNEDDINLDAITNTTNIDILKTKTQKQGEGSSGDKFGYRTSPPSHNVVEGHGFNGSNRLNSVPVGPPYIVKFSQLPPNFASVDIDDLFHEKFTKFNKCKMFWELNPNPSIATLNSGSVFEQNFKRESKVAFVELITGRDMDKILKYWTQPLLKYYNIKVEPAQFGDFNEYNAKVKFLTDPRDDASKPYIPPKPRQHSKSSKSNPFGSAKPVDTQSKILEIEEKVGKLHVEDTSTLRRISGSEPGNQQQQQQQQQHHHRVVLLKKSNEEDPGLSSSAIEEAPVKEAPAKPLSYLQVIKKTAEEAKKSPSSSSATSRLSSPATNPATLATASPVTTTTNTTTSPVDNLSSSSSTSLAKDSLNPPSLENGIQENDKQNQYQQQEQDHDNDTRDAYQTSGEDRPYYKRTSFPDNTGNFRGRGGGRGGTFRRGNGPRGGGFRHHNNNRRGGSFNHNNSSNGSFNNFNNNQQDGKNYPQDEKRYSIFKPASGFLWDSGNDKSTNNYSRRGGHTNRGSYRGGRTRRNNGFTTV